ncbi:MAG TPA: AAA family ATPase [Acidimicrobiales bacterium]|nr:AAA family ATPase [Acidimicrobiales bacterium]
MAFPDDFAERSRAIFERLRTQHDSDEPDDADGRGGGEGADATGQPSPPDDQFAEQRSGTPPVPGDGADRLTAAREEPSPPDNQIADPPSVASLARGDESETVAVSHEESSSSTADETKGGESEPEVEAEGSEDLRTQLPAPDMASGPERPGEPSTAAQDVPRSWNEHEPKTTAPTMAPTLPASEVAGGLTTSIDRVAATATTSPGVVEESATRQQVRELPDPQRFARPLPRVLAIANQKGGVGKTTTTVNLGASLAVLGFRVLVVDLDPQGNATTGLGVNSRNLDASIYDVILHDVPLDDCIEPTSLRNLFVAPATIDLAGAEIELVPAFSREQRLKRALADVKEDYDFVLVDCPPSLGLLTVNALSAASEVLVPIQCEYYALEGLGQLLRNINLVQSNLNPDLELSAIVLTMYDARTKLAEQVADEVREHFGDRVCRNVIPRTVRLSEAPSFGQPIIVFDPSSRGALAYRELAREVSGGPPQRSR